MKTHLKQILNVLMEKTGFRDLPLRNFPPQTRELVHQIRKKNLTYLSSKKISRLLRICEISRQAGTEGLFIEAGCALGGSSILLAKHKPKECELRVYDVFGTIPPPSERDAPDVHERYKTISSGKSVGLGGDLYYGYQDNLYERVCKTFAEFGIEPNTNGVHLIRGLVQDTLHVDKPVFFAHIDVDWYDPVMICLERIVPRLCSDGFIVLDDYKDWSGCHKAVNDYFRSSKTNFHFDLSSGNLVITRSPNKRV